MVWAWGICILWRRFRRLYGWDFDGGMSGAKTWLGFPRIWLKRQVSAVATSSKRVGWSGGKNLLFTNLVTTASSWLLSPALQKPHHADDAYVSREMMWARVTVHRASPHKPWARRVRRAYTVWQWLICGTLLGGRLSCRRWQKIEPPQVARGGGV